MRSSSTSAGAAFRRVAATLACLLLLGGCAVSEGRDLRIGLIVPLSGPLAAFGPLNLHAAQLAIRKTNQDGGLLAGGRRHRVVLVEKDDGSAPEKALGAAQELITRDRVSAIIGPSLSGSIEPVARLAEKSGVPMVLRTSSNPQTLAGTRNMFRVCYGSDLQGAAIARLVRERLGARTVAILYESSNLGNSNIVTAFSRSFSAAGGRVLILEGYLYGQKDFRALLRPIKEAAPDCLFLPNYSFDLFTQLEQARALGISAIIVCSDAVGFEPVSSFTRLPGIWFPVHFDPADPAPNVRGFVHDYTEMLGISPNTSAALVYDACSLLLEAARTSGGVTRDAIRAGLKGTRSFAGVTGTLEYAGSPEPKRDVPFMNVVGGKPVFQLRIAP